MKKVFFIAALLISSVAFAQDTTKVKGLQMMTRIIEYIAPQLTLSMDNDSLYQVYIDLRPKFRISNPPSGNTLVTIDSIPTIELANIYNYTLSNNDGLGYGSQFKSTIATVRAANPYLDRLCTGYEVFWTNRLLAIRDIGRRMLRGK
jgi:hypothetical protein